MKEFLKKQLGHLLFGFIILLPVAVMAVMAIWVFKSIDKFGQSILSVSSFGETLPPGLGFLTIVLLIYLSGILLRKTRIRNLTAKIPILGSLLGGDGTGQTMGIERILGLQPCLFLYSPTCLSYGLILNCATPSPGPAKPKLGIAPKLTLSKSRPKKPKQPSAPVHHPQLTKQHSGWTKA